MTEHGLTPFQIRVYEATQQIPKGKVATYAWVARVIGCKSALAVGQALRKCPLSEVPCHRVVSSDLTVGGYGGDRDGPEVRRKRHLLEREGVRFTPEGLIEQECLEE